jgi:hypothetical protein
MSSSGLYGVVRRGGRSTGLKHPLDHLGKSTPRPIDTEGTGALQARLNQFVTQTAVAQHSLNCSGDKDR